MPRGVGERAKRPLEVRFRERFDSSAGPLACWPWTGTRSKDGYGLIATGNQQFRATHIALLLDGRPLRSGEQACHSCDNPPCVNPRHLFAGTAKDNRIDMALKGRGWHGPRSEEHRARQGAGARAYWAAHPERHSRAIRTHCPSGHPYDVLNTYLDPRGRRKCRTCNRQRAHARVERNRIARSA